MNRYSIEIFFPAPMHAVTLEQRLHIAYELFSCLGRYDPLLLAKEWLVATGDRDGSFRYPAFENDKPSTALLAYYNEQNRGKAADDARHITLWNGQLERGLGASFTDQYNHKRSEPENISLAVHDIGRWKNWEAAADVIKTSVNLYKPRAMFIQPARYEPVFLDKPSVGWMLYLPRVLTPSEVPEARHLEPVLDADGKRLGTIVISITDGILDVNNPEHINLAHDIEIRLADQDLLPRYPLLSTQ
ncbi:Imm52 family immunity protein [Herbaspirillum robiniae]|uniref:Uncharacterized protein n=1 Tax=Herbaspirillum robiniae TaxID=2014887 RepID=A0A246WN24_9BURK|nr:Imm52 family immunity protein [Herbaspirillum robiniae]OWY27396.1 hypothetical protein CEJ42_20340 [Herbaspirillum robiniae]